MEFQFNVRDSMLGHQVDTGEFCNIYLVPGKQVSPIERLVKRNQYTTNLQNFYQLVQKMGQLSSKAQQLPQIITTYDKMRLSDHNTYILAHPTKSNTATGFIRVGRKHLFLNDRFGRHHEVEPLSVLDFYVHESSQRKGYGLLLFRAMLQTEDVKHPCQLAIDKPSTKFLNFLKKHYKLSYDIQQVNNYVVFEGFFKRDNLEKNKYPTKKYNSALTIRPTEQAAIFTRARNKVREEEARNAAEQARLSGEFPIQKYDYVEEPVKLSQDGMETDTALAGYGEKVHRRDSIGMATALFNENDHKHHEFNQVQLPVTRLEPPLAGGYGSRTTSRQNSGERAVQSANLRRTPYHVNHDETPHPSPTRHHLSNGDAFRAPPSPLNPLQISPVQSRNRPSEGSDFLTAPFNTRPSYGANRRTPISPPHNEHISPRERLQNKARQGVQRHSSGDPFTIQKQTVEMQNQHLSRGGKLPAIGSDVKKYVENGQSIGNFNSTYSEQTRQRTQSDPYYNQLRRQTANFRDRLREAQGNSSWNVFGVPRSYTTYAYK